MSPVQLVPSPNDDTFAVSEADKLGNPINQTGWNKSGMWRWREFGDEVQLKNPAFPWLKLDLYRSEVEDLAIVLGIILKEPMPLPYRVSRWHRLKQWWKRKVWNRKHYAELDLARKALIDEYTRRGPWG